MEQGKMALTLRVALANSQRSCTRRTQLAAKGLTSAIAMPSDGGPPNGDKVAVDGLEALDSRRDRLGHLFGHCARAGRGWLSDVPSRRMWLSVCLLA